MGRWPANVIISDCPSILAQFPETSSGGGKRNGAAIGGVYGDYRGEDSTRIYSTDSGSAARFFLNASDDHPLRSIVEFLGKLTTPPGGKVLVYNLPAAAIIGLEYLGFDVTRYDAV